MEPIYAGIVIFMLLFGGLWGVHEWTDGDGSGGNDTYQQCKPH